MTAVIGRPPTPLRARVLSRILVPLDTNACWEWTGGHTPEGYAQVYNADGTNLVHRLMFEWWNGPTPPGMVLDHLCRNRACVSPTDDHQEPVTQRVNILRGVGVAAVNAKKTECPRGHPYSHVNSRGKRCCRQCQNEAGKRWYNNKKGRQS